MIKASNIYFLHRSPPAPFNNLKGFCIWCRQYPKLCILSLPSCCASPSWFPFTFVTSIPSGWTIPKAGGWCYWWSGADWGKETNLNTKTKSSLPFPLPVSTAGVVVGKAVSFLTSLNSWMKLLLLWLFSLLTCVVPGLFGAQPHNPPPRCLQL